MQQPDQPPANVPGRHPRWRRWRAVLADCWHRPDNLDVSRLKFAWVVLRQEGLRMWQVTVALLLLLGATYTAGFFARQWLRHHRELQYAREAEQFLIHGNLRQAGFRSQMALRLNADNAQAIRVLATVLTESGNPQAVDWWQREVEVQPTLTNRLALAEVALHLERYPFPTATKALNEVDAAGRATETYQHLAGVLAAALNQNESAAAFFAEALRLDPTNQENQLSLAIVQLSFTNAPIHEAARTRLLALTNSPGLGLRALRPLAAESFAREDYPAAGKLMRQILARPRANFADHMTYLRLLDVQASPDFPSFLAQVEQAAATNGVAIHELAGWLTTTKQAGPALAWLTNLPPNMTKPIGIRMDIAYARVALGQWAELAAFLKNEYNWDTMEPLRLALLARAEDGLGKTEAAAEAWKNAMEVAAAAPEDLKKLASAAVAWGLTDHAADVLWLAATRYPGLTWPFTDLNELYAAKQDTAKLRQVAKVLAQRDLDNVMAGCTYALYSLLLNQDVVNAAELAKAAWTASPTNVIYARIQALALLKTGQPQGALAVFQQLPPRQLTDPATSVYYGLALAATGDHAGALPWLDRSAQTRLLPEERTLVDQARGTR